MSAHTEIPDLHLGHRTILLAWPVFIAVLLSVIAYAYYTGAEVTGFKSELSVLKASVISVEQECAKLNSLELRTNIEYIRKDVAEIKECIKAMDARLASHEVSSKK